jgi:hypothetical protein
VAEKYDGAFFFPCFGPDDRPALVPVGPVTVSFDSVPVSPDQVQDQDPGKQPERMEVLAKICKNSHILSHHFRKNIHSL